MATTLTPILSAQWDAPRSWSLDTYESGGGYGALRTALAMAPADVVTPSSSAQNAIPRGLTNPSSAWIRWSSGSRPERACG